MNTKELEDYILHLRAEIKQLKDKIRPLERELEKRKSDLIGYVSQLNYLKEQEK